MQKITFILFIILFLLKPLKYKAQPDTIIVYDITSHTISTILPVTYNPAVLFAKTTSNIGTSGNQVLLNTNPPTSNLFSGVNFSQLVKAADVFDLTSYPSRTAVALRYYRADSLKTGCSGIMVSPNFVLSAGHCVFNYSNQAFSQFDSLKISPAYNNGIEQIGIPSSIAKRIYIFKTYYDKTNWDDISLIELTEPIGIQTGWVGIGYDTNPNNYLNKVFHKFSYPAANSPAGPLAFYNGDTLYYNYGYISSATTFIDINSPQAIGIPGQSGSSFLFTDNTDYYSVGVMNFSSHYMHYKITNSVFYQLENILTNTSTDISNSVIDDSLKIYPNPAKDLLFVELNHSEEEPEITIHNSLGQIVVQSFTQEKDKIHINTSSLASGVYFLQLKNKKAVYSKKFMKN